jgi:hypothetical protein
VLQCNIFLEIRSFHFFCALFVTADAVPFCALFVTAHAVPFCALFVTADAVPFRALFVTADAVPFRALFVTADAAPFCALFVTADAVQLSVMHSACILTYTKCRTLNVFHSVLARQSSNEQLFTRFLYVSLPPDILII